MFYNIVLLSVVQQIESAVLLYYIPSFFWLKKYEVLITEVFNYNALELEALQKTLLIPTLKVKYIMT